MTVKKNEFSVISNRWLVLAMHANSIHITQEPHKTHRLNLVKALQNL